MNSTKVLWQTWWAAFQRQPLEVAQREGKKDGHCNQRKRKLGGYLWSAGQATGEPKRWRSKREAGMWKGNETPTSVIPLPMQGSHFLGTRYTETPFCESVGCTSNHKKHGIWTSGVTHWATRKHNNSLQDFQNIKMQQLQLSKKKTFPNCRKFANWHYNAWLLSL